MGSKPIIWEFPYDVGKFSDKSEEEEFTTTIVAKYKIKIFQKIHFFFSPRMAAKSLIRDLEEKRSYLHLNEKEPPLLDAIKEEIKKISLKSKKTTNRNYFYLFQVSNFIKTNCICCR
jgi:hypothetical protein